MHGSTACRSYLKLSSEGPDKHVDIRRDSQSRLWLVDLDAAKWGFPDSGACQFNLRGIIIGVVLLRLVSVMGPLHMHSSNFLPFTSVTEC